MFWPGACSVIIHNKSTYLYGFVLIAMTFTPNARTGISIVYKNFHHVYFNKYKDAACELVDLRLHSASTRCVLYHVGIPSEGYTRTVGGIWKISYCSCRGFGLTHVRWIAACLTACIFRYLLGFCLDSKTLHWYIKSSIDFHNAQTSVWCNKRFGVGLLTIWWRAKHSWSTNHCLDTRASTNNSQHKHVLDSHTVLKKSSYSSAWKERKSLILRERVFTSGSLQSFCSEWCVSCVDWIHSYCALFEEWLFCVYQKSCACGRLINLGHRTCTQSWGGHVSVADWWKSSLSSVW